MKALIIGLDGGTFSVLDPLIQAGHMPHLKKIMDCGVNCELLSTIPAVTALAWPTFMTGKNPGKHGVLGWQAPLNTDYDRPWISSHQIEGLKLWDVVAQSGLRSCVVNVPVTYPPAPLSGVMVTGLLTPGLDVNFTYPPELKTALLEAIPEYKIDIDVQHAQPRTTNAKSVHAFLDAAIIVTQTRGKAMRWLLEREQPDLGMIVFELPDRLQHVLWRYVAQLPNLHAVQKSDQIILEKLLDCYKVLDDEIGQLTGNLAEDVWLVFLSDHGFGPFHSNLYLNDWLAQNRWLSYADHQIAWWEFLRWVGKKLKNILPSSVLQGAKRQLPLFRTLDWARTQAYAGLPTENGIFLNLQNREPAGIVAASDYELLRTNIIQALSEFRDPRNQNPIFKRIYRREELYSGPFLTHAPDIIFELHRGYRVSELTGKGSLVGDISQEPWGIHEREGILLLRGPGIKVMPNRKSAYIQDVTPTLLYALGIPVPDDVDGRVLQELFTQNFTRHNQPHFHSYPTASNGEKNTLVFSEKESENIEERLRSLGYIE